jgi:hypothetical protein
MTFFSQKYISGADLDLFRSHSVPPEAPGAERGYSCGGRTSIHEQQPPAEASRLGVLMPLELLRKASLPAGS